MLLNQFCLIKLQDDFIIIKLIYINSGESETIYWSINNWFDVCDYSDGLVSRPEFYEASD